MPDNTIESKKTYSTGELAASCGVSVRTVQYYDEKGLLPPSAPLAIAAGAFLMRAYRKRVAYVCPHCRSVFVPKALGWFFANHTPTTRKVTCTRCGSRDWCAEVSSAQLGREASR